MDNKKDPLKDNLTNEMLNKRFPSQFDLVIYAIRLAENMIKTGREPRFRMDIQNSAMQILGEIATGQDKFDDIPKEEITDRKDFSFDTRSMNVKEYSDEIAPKAERKKTRKILTHL